MTRDLLEIASFLATDHWTWLVILSGMVGAIAAISVRGRRAVLIGGAVPWFALLSWLLYNEYFVPYQGGGASMWPVAQLLGGTVAAFVGAGTAKLVQRAKRTTSS